MTLESFLLLFLALLFFVGGWYGLSYLFNPQLKNPDGFARITGECGDTMEIGFKIIDGKIAETNTWTDGCNMSRQCLDSAARLALHKRPNEIASINMLHIAEEVGHIPDSHLHCALLAENALHQALDSFFVRERQPTQQPTHSLPNE